jgi:hypothetical protein
VTQDPGPGSQGGEAGGFYPGYGAPPPGSAPPPGYGQYAGYGQYGQYGQYPGYGRPAAPKPGIIPLRPLNVGEILDGAFTAMRWNPKTILVSSAVVAAISGILMTTVTLWVRHGVLANVNLPGNGQTTITGSQVLGFVGVAFALAGVSLVFTFLSHTILTGVITVAVGQGVLGRKETLGDSWRATRSRLGPLFAVMLLSALFIGLGVTLAVGFFVLMGVLLGAVAHLVPLGVLIGVVGGLTAMVFAAIITVRWSLAIPVVMLERRAPLASLRRSWQLVRRSSWRVFWITLLIQIVVSIASGIIQAPFTFASGAGLFTTSAATQSLGGTVIAVIGGIIASAVTAPLSAGAVVLLYADLRMRREGMDITLQAAAAGSEGTAGRQPGGQHADPW